MAAPSTRKFIAYLAMSSSDPTLSLDLEVPMSVRGTALSTVLLALAMVACAKDESDQNKAALSQREKDSILAGSQIPGARAVKKTLTTADSAAARQARIDSAQQNP